MCNSKVMAKNVFGTFIWIRRIVDSLFLEISYMHRSCDGDDVTKITGDDVKNVNFTNDELI